MPCLDSTVVDIQVEKEGDFDSVCTRVSTMSSGGTIEIPRGRVGSSIQYHSIYQCVPSPFPLVVRIHV